MSDSARKLSAVKVIGTKRFSQEEVFAATGLRLGMPVDDNDFKKASRRLADSGAFTDIVYSFSFSSAGTKLELHLTDAGPFVPARFEDFIWYSDEELQRALKSRIPLFNGELPLSGRLPEQVSDVLQALLIEKNVPGHVTYVRFPGPGGAIESIRYSVGDVQIRVQDVEFTGDNLAERSLLEEEAQKYSGRPYSRTDFTTFVENRLLPIYRAKGYLKAVFGPPHPKVVKLPQPSAGDESRDQTLVNVVAAVTPGEKYIVSAIEWSGNHEIPTATLQTMVHAKIGQPANSVRLTDDLAEVQTLYGSRGFVTASIKANAEFDDAKSIVTFRLEVKEDYIYHMGELQFRGLDNGLTAKLRAAWKLRPGDVYDAGYLKDYLAEANKLLPQAFDWGVDPHVTANVRDKTVDVDLQYTVKVPK